MARPEDCFAVSTPYGEESHRSLYLSLLGCDLNAGQTRTAHALLAIRRDLSDTQAIECYEAFPAPGLCRPLDRSDQPSSLHPKGAILIVFSLLTVLISCVQTVQDLITGNLAMRPRVGRTRLVLNRPSAGSCTTGYPGAMLRRGYRSGSRQG